MYTTREARSRISNLTRYLTTPVENDPELRRYNDPRSPDYIEGLRIVDLHQEENDVKIQEQVRYITKHSSIATPDEMERCLPTEVDIETLRLEATSKFYSFDAVKALGCAVGAVFYGISEGHGDVAHVANLKSEIRGLRKVGGPSVSGHALAGGIGDAKDLYIVKVPQQKEAERDLTHELFVGLNGTNHLRKGFNGKPGIPNLAMVLGGSMCSPAAIGTDGKATVCSGVGDEVQMTIYENISPAMTLAKYILTASVDDFLSIYSQELRTLRIGSYYIGYTHYDAHTENKMMRTVRSGSGAPAKFSIPYDVPGTSRVEYVSARCVSTTIDFGMSSITYDGQEYGAYDAELETHGVAAGPNPLHDAYKTLMFIGFDLVNAKKLSSPILAEAAKIFRYFNRSESYVGCVESQFEHRYSFVPGPSTDNLTLEGLIEHVSRVCDLKGIVSDVPTYPVLECGGKGSVHPHDRCFTFAGEINEASSKKRAPGSFLELYDRLAHSDKPESVLEGFDYNKAKEHYVELVKDEIARLDSSLSSPVLTEVPVIQDGVTQDALRNSALVKTLSEGLSLVLLAVSAYSNASIWLKIGHRVAVLYQDRELVEQIRAMQDQIKAHNSKLNRIVDLYRRNYRNMRPVIESTKWETIFHERYPWYRDSGSTIMGLVDRIAREEKELYQPLSLPAVLLPVSVPTGTRNGDTVLPRNRRTSLVKDNAGKPLRIDTVGR